MDTKRRRGVRAGWFVGALLLAFAPVGASACVIDNTASLSANGARATLTTDMRVGAALWAPFTFTKSFAADDSIQLAESRADLARSLPPSMLAAPYKWSFGDGATALGHVVTHRYAHPGLYQISMYGYNAGTHGWYSFDKALMRVVPPGQVLGANLGYYALRALDVVMSSLLWLADAALALLVLAVVVSRRRARRPRASGRA